MLLRKSKTTFFSRSILTSP